MYDTNLLKGLCHCSSTAMNVQAHKRSSDQVHVQTLT